MAPPRRKTDNRAGAEKAYKSALRRGAKHHEIIAGTKSYKASWDPACDTMYMPMAKTWLTNDHFKDEHPSREMAVISKKQIWVGGRGYSWADYLRLRKAYQSGISLEPADLEAIRRWENE